MPPRLRVQSKHLRITIPRNTPYVCWQCRQASVAAVPAPPLDQAIHVAPSIARYPPTQPPSYKPPEFRKSQLHRQYQSFLKATPLFLIFQHNNVKATEWSGIRRELAVALRKVDEELAKEGRQEGIDGVGESVKLSIVQTGIFASALRVTEFWDPDFSQAEAGGKGRTENPSSSKPQSLDGSSNADGTAITHGLSKEAWLASKRNRQPSTGLEPLLSGPLALLAFPSVSPQHLKAALSILAPSPDFPAPKRRTTPSYHEPAVQQGLQKLMLLGARIEGKAFDQEGTRWVGSIQGGLDGLRAQLVAMLSSLPAQLTSMLEGASKSLYLTMESRKSQMEEEQKGEKQSES